MTDGTSNTALIIDDDVDLCFMLSSIIKNKEFEVSVVHNLNDAKNSLNHFIPTIIVLDNTLPDGFGLDFIGYLEANCPQAKVVLMTGDNELVPNSNQMRNISKFIMKPFSLDEFRRNIEALI